MRRRPQAPTGKASLVAAIKAASKIRGTLDQDILRDTSEVKGFLSTGDVRLDLAMGGGIAMPKYTVFSGEPQAGKSVLALIVSRSIQKEGGLVIYANSEEAPIKPRAAQLGVDVDAVVWITPKAILDYYPGNKRQSPPVKGLLSNVMDATAAVSDFEGPILLVVDSVSATRPSSEAEGKNQPGAHAHDMSKFLRALNPELGRRNLTVILINHLTQKMDVNPMMRGGKTSTFVAERHQTYYGVVTVELTKLKRIEGGQLVRATVTKNKLTGDIIRSVEIPLNYTTGIDPLPSAIELLAEHSPRRGYISVGGEFLGRNKIVDSIGDWSTFQKNSLINDATALMNRLAEEARSHGIGFVEEAPPSEPEE